MLPRQMFGIPVITPAEGEAVTVTAAVAKQVEEVKKYPGISKILVAKSADLLNP